MRVQTRSIAAVLAGVIVAGAAILHGLTSPGLATAQLGDSTPAYAIPDPDAFYRPPADLAQLQPGDVVRVRSVDTRVYADSMGWQLAFRSTNSQGDPILGVTTVLVPRGVTKPPVLSYQAIVNALGSQCAPSRGLFNLEQVEAPGLLIPLQRGWAVNVPDHLGPTNAYGAARLGGMVTLDSVRAVKNATELGLVSSPVALAGYSGGGMASGWAAALQPTYAPELDIVGVVQGGVPADLEQMADLIGNEPHPGFGLGFAAAIGLEREYPDRFRMSQQLNERGLSLRNFLSNECRRSILFHGVFHNAGVLTRSNGWLNNGDARDVLRENSLRHFEGVPEVSVYMWHGRLDPLTPYDGIEEIAQKYCSAGVQLTFVTYDIAEHLIPAAAGFGDAYEYLAARFRGEPAPSTC
ncbi:lipase [Hoyosella rhizosphaerae]|uniref:Lipase n=1 Tax=Hoyosella rhizosphaerae TaxID=1755582 RepID=A0A916U4I6_9ACTN|nr:lipase family protein [Hoyosella rhizosphaerae]MBN4926683.1 lipase [Hoyosella rhizosphaerae]GGC57259.1 lipase [Hoyosella rhizosphaerae]